MTRSEVLLIQGETLRQLRELPGASVDAVVTDPPYSSGGFTRADRSRPTGAKYSLTSTSVRYPEFSGDNRDQRSWAYWCALWLSECQRIVRPGGYLMMFSDWRQLPSATDALQAGGWLYRGNVIWDKTEGARPQKAWFRTGQIEYVLLASNGAMPPEQEREGPCLEGVFRFPVNGETKFHQTGKPVALMRWLLSILPDVARVLDPFAGAGATLVAAKELYLQATGIEASAEYCEIAAKRLEGVL